MNRAVIKNLPKNLKKILDEVLSVSFNNWVDELRVTSNPSIPVRQLSKLDFNQAFKIIQSNDPHWVFYDKGDYWELEGCNMIIADVGVIFIWVQVKPEIAEEIFKKYRLKY